MPDTTAPSRLAREFRRLYGQAPAPAPAPAADTAGGVRALVLEVARPAEWQPLGALWKGVQADLGLPAPAIAANGHDGLQLWFSLAEPLAAAQAHAFLEGLRLRYLADLPQHRVALMTAPVPPQVPARVSAAPPADDRWSAFVAADLAPIFEETPWLDLAPSEEGQADLLSRLGSIQAAPLAAAWARLQPKPIEKWPALAQAPGSTAHPQAGQFLLTVMNDDTAPLALRVEAAKALLPFGPPAH
jgi:hypothetical protein